LRFELERTVTHRATGPSKNNDEVERMAREEDPQRVAFDPPPDMRVRGCRQDACSVNITQEHVLSIHIGKEILDA
jgi:hypothetical protein